MCGPATGHMRLYTMSPARLTTATATAVRQRGRILCIWECPSRGDAPGSFARVSMVCGHVDVGELAEFLARGDSRRQGIQLRILSVKLAPSSGRLRLLGCERDCSPVDHPLHRHGECATSPRAAPASSWKPNRPRDEADDAQGGVAGAEVVDGEANSARLQARNTARLRSGPASRRFR